MKSKIIAIIPARGGSKMEDTSTKPIIEIGQSQYLYRLDIYNGKYQNGYKYR